MKYIFWGFIFCYSIFVPAHAQELPTNPWGNSITQSSPQQIAPTAQNQNSSEAKQADLPTNPWNDKAYLLTNQNSSSSDSNPTIISEASPINKTALQQRQRRAASSGNLRETFRLTTRSDSYRKQGGRSSNKNSGFDSFMKDIKATTAATKSSVPSAPAVNTDVFNNYLNDTMRIIEKNGGIDTRGLLNKI